MAAAQEIGKDPEEGEPASVNWERAHGELVRLAQTRAGLDHEEGRWLLVALRSGSHARLGYGSFVEYVERLFGYSPRFTHERLRVAEALEELPVLSERLSGGELSWSALREITRIATPKTEARWAEAAQGRSMREVERLVSGHRPGDEPDDPTDPAARRHVLRLELSAEALATFREAMAKLRRETGESLDDDTAVLLMSRQVLGGPTDPGRASYQVALTVCDKCERGQQHGRGELMEISPEVIDMTRCDAQMIGPPHVGEAGRAKQTIPPATRRQVMSRDGGRCVVPGCRHAVFVDIHHIEPRAESGDNDTDNLVCLCGAHHRALHRGKLSVEGRVSSGLVFRHADGTKYGCATTPKAVDLRALAFRGLVQMGFRETEARRAVERVTSGALDDLTLETLMRQALAVLTESLVRR
jgi:HNH endonuclease